MEQTLEQNKTFIRNHFEEFVNRKNSAIAYQNFASNFIDREEPFVGLASPELVKQTMDKALALTVLKMPSLRWLKMLTLTTSR
ncbi:hypothetical protein [Scytonema hofmannii]|nr:hypothetical protein [Scytonema hofmannii]